MAHLGPRAFDEIGGEVVQTTSFVLLNKTIAKHKGCYYRLIEPTSQSGKEKMFLTGNEKYIAKQDNFKLLPNQTIAYWVPNNAF